MLNINLNLYKSFYYVAKYEGFSKASSQVFISQSNLSENVKKLESELGLLLFDRTSKGVKLTQNGKKLFSKLENIKYVLDDDAYGNNEINIGCLRFIADNYLSNYIADFLKSNSDVKFNIEISNDSELFQKLRRGQLDVIFSRFPSFYKFDGDFVIKKIIRSFNVFVCSKNFYEREKENFNKEDYKFPLILPPSSEKRRNIDNYFFENNILFKNIIDVPNSNLLKTFILNDLGIAYINKKFIEQEILDDKVVIIDKFNNLPVDNICIIYNSKKVDNITKSFIELIENYR